MAQLGSLADLSLEQLSQVQVTSVSGHAEPLQDAAASIYVITAQDIRRSAATSLPEVLRLAPNLQVAQVDAGSWAISARGFNTAIANKLLVLIDGRTIYSNLFSGVIWEANRVMLEDIERIEVISGPGGTLWGANAVNGVINVITRQAADTQGVLASAVRSHDGGREAVRWGGRLGGGAVRVYGLATDRGNTRRLDGTGVDDAASRLQTGFRADWQSGPGGLTLQGDAYRGGSEPASRSAPRQYGGNLLARWSSRLAGGSPYTLQAYWDVADYDQLTAIRNRSTNLDLQFSQEPLLPAGHHLVWGGGWRRGFDANQASELVLLQPAERQLTWSHLFVQHQLRLARRWQLTAGVKAERNSYTGLEWLPNLRLAYEHGPQSTTWAAASRAVRAPSRIDRDFFFPGRAPFLIAGGPDFESEVADVLELGHRGRWGNTLSYAATVFRQQYRGLRAGVPGQVPARVSNQVEGTNDGIEAWGQWQLAPAWRLAAGWLAQHKDLRFSSGATDAVSIANLGNDPSHQWSLRSYLSLGARTEFDLALRRVGALPAPQVPAYTAVDARLAFQVTPSLALSVLGQNLFDRGHREFEPAAVGSVIGRRLYLKAVWQL
ncbi:conserved hypothetical protein [Ramlibacter tataouinensis TTB310]|uniref:TonB-dependent receptor n=1 Tax=Ramlibacter tataouinensis (strain ATCC BAA-407 / DSM 14655 / LMG 21543 / TTB310) TaxID=365046 RepID=F5Y660_RAMTT|nr:conserved hypothetical protein [Ramlibacter tataouinensis TTB310]